MKQPAEFLVPISCSCLSIHPQVCLSMLTILSIWCDREQTESHTTCQEKTAFHMFLFCPTLPYKMLFKFDLKLILKDHLNGLFAGYRKFNPGPDSKQAPSGEDMAKALLKTLQSKAICLYKQLKLLDGHNGFAWECVTYIQHKQYFCLSTAKKLHSLPCMQFCIHGWVIDWVIITTWFECLECLVVIFCCRQHQQSSLPVPPPCWPNSFGSGLPAP